MLFLPDLTFLPSLDLTLWILPHSNYSEFRHILDILLVLKIFSEDWFTDLFNLCIAGTLRLLDCLLGSISLFALHVPRIETADQYDAFDHIEWVQCGSVDDHDILHIAQDVLFLAVVIDGLECDLENQKDDDHDLELVADVPGDFRDWHAQCAVSKELVINGVAFWGIFAV